MKPKLVRNWRSAWKWHSTRILAAIAVLPIVWMELPPEVKMLVPASWQPWIFSGIALAGIIGRIKDQGTDKP